MVTSCSERYKYTIFLYSRIWCWICCWMQCWIWCWIVFHKLTASAYTGWKFISLFISKLSCKQVTNGRTAFFLWIFRNFLACQFIKNKTPPQTFPYQFCRNIKEHLFCRPSLNDCFKCMLISRFFYDCLLNCKQKLGNKKISEIFASERKSKYTYFRRNSYFCVTPKNQALHQIASLFLK